MGRLTPDRPARTCGNFRCAYCGRYGAPGACDGCGAPNAPAAEPMPERRTDIIHRFLTVNEARTMLGFNPIPAFPLVRR